MSLTTSPTTSEAFVQCPNCGGPIKIGMTSCDGCNAGKKWDEMPVNEPAVLKFSLTLSMVVCAVIEVATYAIRDRLKSSVSPDAINSAFFILMLIKVILIGMTLHLFSKYQARKNRKIQGGQ